MHPNALEAAERHFPQQARQVQRLFYQDAAFHSMCEDLAAVTETLEHMDRHPEKVREERRQEYVALMEALLKEMSEALDRSKIVRLRPRADPNPDPE